MNFRMLRSVKQIVWLAGLIIGCQSAWGFALIGPIPTAGPDAYQTPTIAYGLISDLGAPKDIKDEYRRNTPVLYYSFDSSFYSYFGTNGVAEVDKALAMYNAIGDVSQYSTDLSEFPTDSRRVNFTAAAAELLDLKSFIMGQMTEELGFFQPTRWVWALRDRKHVGTAPCPADMLYGIIKRNFSYVPVDASTYPNSSYVNGVLYSYSIFEVCQPPNPVADAVEFPVDPLASPYSAVADFLSFWYDGLAAGGFYTSLTRDDVGALRYLINTNNFNVEASGPRTTEFLTNDVPTTIQTFDLSLFAQQALTNNGAALSALYPGLVVTSDTNFFGITITTNVTETLVTSPFDPAGTLPHIGIFSTNYTTNAFTFFGHTFGNLVTNTSSSIGLVGTVNLQLSQNPFAAAGTLAVTTNFGITPIFVPGAFGDFFILPTNLCGAQVLSNLTTTVTATTNLPQLISTVVPGVTNPAITFIPGSVSFFTNHTVAILPVTCPVDSVADRGGMGKVIFVKRDYDAIVGQFWQPVTNDYTLFESDETNSLIFPRHMQRRVPRPDFLFSCADLADDTTFTYSNTVDGVTAMFTQTFTLTGVGENLDVRTLGFNSPNPPNVAGPGTIEGPTVLPDLIILNKTAPYFENTFPGDETIQAKFEAWGSFDGTTNTPIVYPNGESLAEIEKDLLTGPAMVNRYLPNANVGLPYSAQLTATGANGPFTWSLAPGSPGLPDGLTLTPDGQITGTPTGPAAIYDFTLRITDTAGATRDAQNTITIF